MPTLRVTVHAEVDGQVLPGFPLIKRITTDQISVFNPATKPADDPPGTYTSLPIEHLGTVQALVLRPDATITLRLDGQTDAGIPLGPDSLFLVVGTDLDAGVTVNASVSAAAATAVRGWAMGAVTP